MRSNDAPPPPFRGRLTFSQCASQPTASQALSAALSGCSLNSQGGGGAAAGSGGGDAAPPPPPPPRWGAPPPPPPPPFAPVDDAADVPLSQLASQVPDALMLGSQDFLTPADQGLDPPPLAAATALGRHARSPAAAPSPLRGAAKRARAPPRGLAATSTPAPEGLPPSHLNPAARRRPPGSPPVARNPFVPSAAATAATAAAAAAVDAAVAQRWPLVSRYRAEYREIATLGAGAFARVVRAVHRLDGVEYAVKRSAREVFAPADAARWQLEAAAAAAVPAHPGIVRYYGSWAEPGPTGGVTFYIALEACGVSVGTRAAVAGGAALAETDVISIGTQAAAALAHMHRAGVAHGDVKPDNMLTGARDESTVKLSDFGLASPLAADAAARAPLAPDEGDCRYVAPEVLAGTADPAALDKADVFALGASLYELASGAPLPRGGAAYRDVRCGRARLLPGVSTGLQRVMRAMMAPEPGDRPAAAAVERMLGRLAKPAVESGPAVPATENVPPARLDAAMADVGKVVKAPAANGFGRLALRPA